MYRVELYLSDYATIRLEEIRFFQPEFSEPLITANGGSPAYCIGASKNLFNWTVGVKAATLLLLKAAIPGKPAASISGEARSLAASLDYALSKEPGWLVDFFGSTNRGGAFARMLFGRRNSERKRPGPVEVYVNDALLPDQNIAIFLNGTRLTGTQILEICAAIENENTGSITVSASPEYSGARTHVRLEQSEFPLTVCERTLSQHYEIRDGLARIRQHSIYRNTSNEPVSFLHYSVNLDPQFGSRNIQIHCPLESAVKWSLIQDANGSSRLLVTFAEPLLPGELREETLSYEVHNYSCSDGRLNHLNRYPIERLTLEFSCPSTHRIAQSTILAEQEDQFLYSVLPRTTRRMSPDGHPCVRWTMKNPPQGFRFRLMWGIEARADKHVELPLDSAIPATLN